MNHGKRGKIIYTLQAISIIPLLLLSIIILFVGFSSFNEAMYDEVAIELKCVAADTALLFDTAYPGEYHLEGEEAYRLYKGDTDITNDYSLIDQVKENTGMDVTLFYQDTRILTTIRTSSGSRYIGTRAADVVLTDVFYTGKSHFYHNAIVNGDAYFSYYMPLTQENGEVVGILFVGKPSREVNQAVQHSLYPLMIAILLTILLISFGITHYTRGIAAILSKIRNFLSEVSKGNLETALSEDVLRRNDELGEIGVSILSMQRSLRTMVEQDALTELFNRRCADRKLKQLIQKSKDKGTPLSLAIGDIDFFKKVNDTYGHDCGDIVLKQVSQALREQMRNEGFVARWGGEEFLLVFEHSDKETAKKSLERLADNIRSLKIPYEGQTVTLTMTFGLAGGSDTNLNVLLRKADDRLYEGKNSGRNCIIS